MSGDPKVLAGLQQAFNASDDPNVKRAIESAWMNETDTWSLVVPSVDKRIRDWTPPADPSLEQRVAALEESWMVLNSAHTCTAEQAHRHEQMIRSANSNHADLKERFESHIEWVVANAKQHPEPTAPDDPVCADEDDCPCGRSLSWHQATGGPCEFPAPAAADLDPVRVEAAAKVAMEARLGLAWSSAQPGLKNLWIRDAEFAIRAYLNGGAS